MRCIQGDIFDPDEIMRGRKLLISESRDDNYQIIDFVSNGNIRIHGIDTQNNKNRMIYESHCDHDILNDQGTICQYVELPDQTILTIQDNCIGIL